MYIYIYIYFKKTLCFYLISSNQREKISFQSSPTFLLMVDTKPDYCDNAQYKYSSPGASIRGSVGALLSLQKPPSPARTTGQTSPAPAKQLDSQEPITPCLSVLYAAASLVKHLGEIEES